MHEGVSILDLLERCLAISEEAYKQEEESGRRLREKVDYLFRWLTIFVGVFNIVIPLIAKSGIQQKSWFVPFYIGLMTVLIVTLVIIITIQYPLKAKRYPLGSDILQKMQKDEKYRDEKYSVYQNILYRDSLTKKLAINNNSIVRKLRWVCVMMIVGMIGIAIFFLLVILNI